MRILQVCHRFHPSVGGTEEMVGRLARGLTASGHAVTVLTAQEPRAPREEVVEGVRIVRLRMRHVGGLRIPVGYRQALRSIPHDLLHVHGQRVWPSDALLPFVGRVRGPKVFTPHGFYQWYMGPRWRGAMYYRLWFARRLGGFDRVVALTRGEAQTLGSWGLGQEKLATIPQGVDPDEFAAAPMAARVGREPAVLYVGGFYPNKRVDLLIRSMARASVPSRLVVVGGPGKDPRALATCRALAEGLGVRADFLGVLPRPQLVEQYSTATLFALPSLFEGFGLSLLEAMAAALPFVSTPVGAAPELSERGAGVVVPEPGAMGEMIRGLLADPGKRATMGGAGREAAKDYTWDRVVQAHVKLYGDLVP